MAEARDIDGQIRQNLKDAACPDELIETIMCSFALGDACKGIHLLTAHRKALLDAVHKNQQYIDCLDYLLYKLNKGVF